MSTFCYPIVKHIASDVNHVPTSLLPKKTATLRVAVKDAEACPPEPYHYGAQEMRSAQFNVPPKSKSLPSSEPSDFMTQMAH
jgi:hypothetical protein